MFVFADDAVSVSKGSDTRSLKSPQAHVTCHVSLEPTATEAVKKTSSCNVFFHATPRYVCLRSCL